MKNFKKIIVFVVSTICTGSFAADALLLEGIKSGNIEKVRTAMDNGAQPHLFHEHINSDALDYAVNQNQITIANYIQMRMNPTSFLFKPASKQADTY